MGDRELISEYVRVCAQISRATEKYTQYIKQVLLSFIKLSDSIMAQVFNKAIESMMPPYSISQS